MIRSCAFDMGLTSQGGLSTHHMLNGCVSSPPGSNIVIQALGCVSLNSLGSIFLYSYIIKIVLNCLVNALLICQNLGYTLSFAKFHIRFVSCTAVVRS